VSTPPRCPFCDGSEVELVSSFGPQILTSQWRCSACGSYFEAIREQFHEPVAGATAPGSNPAK
jgi:transposase-like protein